MHNLLSTFVRKKTASCGLKASLQRIILTTENTERTIASTEKNLYQQKWAWHYQEGATPFRREKHILLNFMAAERIFDFLPSMKCVGHIF